MHVHSNEVTKIGNVHKRLREAFPDLLTFLVPESVKHCEVAIWHLQNFGLKTEMWSSQNVQRKILLRFAD